MSAVPKYEIKYSKSALDSLDELDPSLHTDMTKVLLDLGTLLQAAPYRIYRNRNGQWVYRHPSPKVEITYTFEESSGVVECVHVAAPLARPTGFVSYCHKDRKFFEENLQPYLDKLEEQGLIRFWDDAQIGSAADWEQELMEALHTAPEALLIVTQPFLVSTYIGGKELPVLEGRYRDGTLHVHWVHADEAIYEGYWFTKVQALCDPKVPLRSMGRPQRVKKLKKIGLELEKRLLGVA